MTGDGLYGFGSLICRELLDDNVNTIFIFSWYQLVDSEIGMTWKLIKRRLLENLYNVQRDISIDVEISTSDDIWNSETEADRALKMKMYC